MYRRDDVAPLGRGKVLYLKGTPYEQGRQLGQGAADLIHENVRRASRLRDQVAAGRDQADYHAVTRKNETFAARAFPELLEELTGIAEGADVAYDELLSLNLNGHIAYVYSAMLACTQVLATGPATADGKTYIGKTRDLSRGPLLQVFLHREYDDGTYLNEIQTAGRMTIPDGINQYGVSLTCSGQWSPRVTVDLARADSAWLNLNLQPILRQACTADDAIRMIEEQPRASGMHVLVADGARGRPRSHQSGRPHVRGGRGDPYPDKSLFRPGSPASRTDIRRKPQQFRPVRPRARDRGRTLRAYLDACYSRHPQRSLAATNGQHLPPRRRRSAVEDVRGDH